MEKDNNNVLPMKVQVKLTESNILAAFEEVFRLYCEPGVTPFGPLLHAVLITREAAFACGFSKEQCTDIEQRLLRERKDNIQASRNEVEENIANSDNKIARLKQQIAAYEKRIQELSET